MASNRPSSSQSLAHIATPQRQPRPAKRQHPSVLNGVSGSFEDKTNDFLCPICFELIEEAFITKCGHTFCYTCIVRSIENYNRCPKCSFILNSLDNIFPNFLLNELISKHKLQIKRGAELTHNIDIQEHPVDELRHFLAAESENLSLPDVNVILEVLTQRKHILEAETCAAQNKLLFNFLEHLLKQKESQLNQLSREVDLIRKDLKEVEVIVKETETRKFELEEKCKVVESDKLMDKDEEESFSNKKPVESSTLAKCRKRMHAHFDDFVQCYFTVRASELHFSKSDVKTPVDTTKGTSSSLDVFRDNLVKFSRYSTLRPLATLNYSSDIFNNSTIVSSIEFDKDNELFAIAGVTKRIKVFDYASVIRDVVDIHYPSIEMISSSKISCVSWNSYHKSTLASSDYEGSVTVWDVSTGQRSKTFQEHEKRCWSVDFNDVDTRLIASGSDDARVKLWSLNMEHSVACLEAKANVCCVKFNPCSSCHLAFGSADHCVHYYDLRNMKEALCVFKGHRKAVSYVKFLNREDIVSASTDSQLKMWNINSAHCLRSFVGHINEKNFVGLATNGDYIGCGSENNSLYVYYKGLSKQLFSFKFDAVRSVLEKEKREEDVNEFVSAVCWRQHSNIVVAANSQGIIKILELV
ncbi:E3 ubiquitin-protein ligase RFWD2-like isoform X1 [Cimex lectularius]|uniref:RING-type domain-containing protein n=1 Tax=Cimex lectularius TaxID=79782 RepID=A0A8I6RD12_CIMLE|nr:E3 ubiquitin-protein ligase RFWD2-like isoform X1 [Cimex lectularius]